MSASSRNQRELPGPRGPLAGAAAVPPSKSLTNRALLLAAVAGGGTVSAPLDCDDTRLLADALALCGWDVVWREREEVRVGARQVPDRPVTVDLGNSGTGARFLLALLAAVPGEVVVDGSPRLRQRPMAPLLDALRRLGAQVQSEGDRLPVRVMGRELEGGALVLAPGVSSQFVSALALAAPLMRHGLDLELVGEVPSRPYLDLTLETLAAFGGAAHLAADGRRLRVAAGGVRAASYAVEGDWSAAAFFLAAAAVAGGRVTVRGVEPASRQGDRAALEVLRPAVAAVTTGEREVSIEGPVRRPIEADLADTPDLFPALAVVAAAAPAGSRLTGLQNLRHKESDRLEVMVAHLRALGAVLEIDRERRSLTVTRPFAPGVVADPPVLAAADDHRIAMALAVAALRRGPLAVDDDRCVDKSFPAFWSAWESLVG